MKNDTQHLKDDIKQVRARLEAACKATSHETAEFERSKAISQS